MSEKKQQRRRQPGASAKRPPQKAPHAMPRKNPSPAPEPVRKEPEVVYLAPKPFSRNRLFLQLATIAAVVVAVLLGLSIFFKVGNIEVSGCDQYTAWEIQQASGIEIGDQLLTINIPKASAKIINALPYVKSVRIGLSLPDTVKIEIVETRVTYALQDQEGTWWRMDSDGQILDKLEAAQNLPYTQIVGLTLESPVVGQQAVATEVTAATNPDGSTVPVTVTGAQRLEAVKAIAQNLERNGIIGDVTSVDVTSLFEIGLQYGDRFQVLLGNTERMDEKIAGLSSTVQLFENEKPYEKVTLDLSDPDHIVYEPEDGSEE